MRIDDVRRITLGTFVRPTEETGGEPRVEGVYGYLVRHEHGLVLLDTGIGAGDEETEAWYRPQRVPLQQALAAAGVDLADLTLVDELSPALRPLRRQPAPRRHSDPGAAHGAGDRARRRLHVRPPARPPRQQLSGDRRRDRGPPGPARDPDAGPCRRAPVAGRGVRGRFGRPRRPVARHGVGSGAPTSWPSGPAHSGTPIRYRPRRPGSSGCWPSTRDASSSPTTQQSGSRLA